MELTENDVIQIRQRVINQEEVSPEELRAALDFCYKRAASRSAAKKESKKQEAAAAAAVDVLDPEDMFAKILEKRNGTTPNS